MWKLCFLLVAVLASVHHLNAWTPEEIETAQVKLDRAKQYISSIKLIFPKCQNEDSSSCSVRNRSFAHINAALALISEAKLTCHSCPETKVIIQRPSDCSDVRAWVSNKSGVYQIWPKVPGLNSNKSIEVYCDMETDGGGWTVIQRRGKFEKQVDFYRDWETYKNGFGDIKQEFWLGNENIFILTNQKKYSVRFDLVESNRREYRYAFHKFFSISDEKSGYALNIKSHSGNLSEDLRIYHNGKEFSTKDRQNTECARKYHSAFWFSDGCGFANLNGIYQPGVVSKKSIYWWNWDTMHSVEIKIRPNDV